MKSTNTITPPIRNSLNRSLLRRGFLLIPLALTYFALSPATLAQLPSPAPDGGYPNFNTAEGDGALFSLTTGNHNTANGAGALQNNRTGMANTATGAGALFSNNADNNTANGLAALQNNTTGSFNTATGAYALDFNTTGSFNTANGYEALLFSNNADNNTANGYEALFSDSSGGNNTATGFQALVANSSGNDNTASGVSALQNNTTGSFNTATGYQALLSNTASGHNNTATGFNALLNNTTGVGNTAEGFQALLHSTGSSNIAVGSNAGANLTTGSNNIDIGAAGAAGESSKIRIGKQGTQNGTFIAGIRGATVASGVGVIVGSNGQLGTVTSSARFKEAIKPMDKASEAILALQPITFRYKHELDPEGIPQFGLVAEQVEKVNPDLVVRGEDGKIMTVRYEAVNAMLLNEFLKEHGQVQQLKATVAQQQEEFHAKFAQQQKQIEALTATVQKVSDQVALSKPAPQLVTNP